jgi:RNA polymerase sigma-70 factor, ECF subfamily
VSAIPMAAGPSRPARPAQGIAALRAVLRQVARDGTAPAGPATGPAATTAGSAGSRAETGGDRPRPRPYATPDGGRPTPPEQPGHDRPDEPNEVWRIVERAQAGDTDAFAELYDRYMDLVFRYIYYRVGTRALAEDLTSETFLRALRRITSVTWQGRDFGAWLVTIARNLVADHYKSGRYRLEVSTADMLDADRAEDGPEGEVLDQLTNATLLETVKRLNPEQQECIVLRFLQGLSVAETAAVMGKNEGAIKALQYRAVRTLGRLLPEGFTP